MKKKVFCNYCKGDLHFQEIEGKTRQVCMACGAIYYENPLPVATIIIANNRRELLLVKRKNEPFQGMWCFPIGFAETGERIAAAALRELKEEAGITGEIVQLIDVDSQQSSFYGDLLVSTFEGRRISGVEKAGDDALAVRYFPISHLPKLAFDSQDKALNKYMALHQEEWTIKSSMERIVLTVEKEMPDGPPFVSDALLDFVEEHSQEIIEFWLQDVFSHPSTATYHYCERDKLCLRAWKVLREFSFWFRGTQPLETIEHFFSQLGQERREEGFKLAEVISSFFLFKKHIWMYVLSKGFWERPLDIYKALEMDKRISHFFDFAVYYASKGFEAG